MAAASVSRPAHARGLYGFLRELDQQGCGLIVALLPVEEGWAPRSPTGCAAPHGPGSPPDQHRRCARTAPDAESRTDP